MLITGLSMYDVCKGAVHAARHNNQYLYVGVDPGATGAFAIRVRGDCGVGDIPTITVKGRKGNKTEYDLAEIGRALRLLWPIRFNVRAVVEEAVVQIPGKGANAIIGFRVGVAFGTWPAMFALLKVSCECVTPSVWKRTMGLTGKDKEASRSLAIKTFPSVARFLSRKKDHNRAEALLLCEWLRRRLSGKT